MKSANSGTKPASRQGRAAKVIASIEDAEHLDGPAFALANAVALPQRIGGTPGQRVQNALHGTWFGHPIHPSLVAIPIGTWTLAVVLDTLASVGAIKGTAIDRTSDILVKAGAVGAVGAALTGLSDWHQTHGRSRRVGLVHAAVNSTALGIQVASIVLRSGGHRIAGRLASAASWGFMFAGSYLGGHLVYRLRQGVDQADRSVVPRGYHPVLPETDLQEDQPCRVEVWDEVERAQIPVVLVRHRGRISAMGARCSHMGGPLDEGWVLNGGLICPWHGSRYDLESGQPLDGPSTCPQPRYHVRVQDGMVEIQREQDPGSTAVTPQEADAARRAEAIPDKTASAPQGRKADEVLFEHHQLLRGLFRRIEAMPADDPERRDILRTLASELEIHEHIEDRIFYPAVQPVSEDVSIAYAEHQALADLLAATLKLSTASPAFEEHIRALHTAVDHHASSEETSMFLEAQRLGDRRLRELGHELETTMEEERTSRFQSAFRHLKISLLESVGKAG
ncbi:Rieske 2Fe-2S domain-containing protein [Altericroceibacterium xinjiangense]|uniref:Rieske 2Fe-2S domain-containing protein n=1 Tax=Altericroceibacterium xinjiangense TaxID=762261 RepID=UPI000F7EDF90|nr:Rieske 2Fe-2S domain-containing protein [Altericroceibacterium xinjiangense]